MTRETKVGLLVGMGVILLIGIIVSDHLSMAQKQTPPDMTDYGSIAQNSLNAEGTGLQTLPVTPPPSTPMAPTQPLPTPEQFQTRTADAGSFNYNQSPAAASATTSQTPGEQNFAAVTAALDSHLSQANQANQAATSQDTNAPSPASNVAPTQSRPTRIADTRLATALARSNADFDTAALASRVEVQANQNNSRGPQPAIHYVQRGETLYAIAQRYYNDGELWHVISKANPNAVKSDNTVNLGVRLVIPNKALLPDLLRQNPQAAALLANVTRESAPVTTTGPRTVVVKTGDTLSGLASEHLGTSRKWKELLAANKDKMDTPQDLRIGMTIVIPASSSNSSNASTSALTSTPAAPRTAASSTQAPSNMVYTVESGDTLTRIAQARLGDGNLWDTIFQANRDQLKNANDLAPGMKIKIPVQR